MIRQVAPIQFGSGEQCYRWVISYTDLNTAAGNSAQTLNLIGSTTPPYNVTLNFQLPQGSLVRWFRAKQTTAFVGTSLTHLWFDVGYPATILNANGTVISNVAAAAPHAINGGSGGGTGGVTLDLSVAVADNEFVAAIAANLCPGDAAFGVTVTFTATGLTAWTALTAGQMALDLFVMPSSMGELWPSQYYGNPSPGNP